MGIAIGFVGSVSVGILLGLSDVSLYVKIPASIFAGFFITMGGIHVFGT